MDNVDHRFGMHTQETINPTLPGDITPNDVLLSARIFGLEKIGKGVSMQKPLIQ